MGAALKHFDIDRSGSLQFNQWLAATMDLEPIELQEHGGLKGQVQALFSSLDKDGDGNIDFEELLVRFGTTSPEELEQLKAFFSELDKDGDGKVSASEFELFWKSIT